jgi:hypothetical protein
LTAIVEFTRVVKLLSGTGHRVCVLFIYVADTITYDDPYENLHVVFAANPDDCNVIVSPGLTFTLVTAAMVTGAGVMYW